MLLLSLCGEGTLRIWAWARLHLYAPKERVEAAMHTGTRVFSCFLWQTRLVRVT